MAIKYAELKSKTHKPEQTAVIAIITGQPPTIDTEKTIKVVKFVAKQNKAQAYILYPNKQDSDTNPLSESQKKYWLERFFPQTIFIPINDNVDKQSMLTTAAKMCYNSGCKHLIVIAHNTHAPVFQNLLKAYNNTDMFRFKSWKVVSSGESIASKEKVLGLATKDDVAEFRKMLPGDCTIADAKRLMNEIRCGLGITKLIESVSFKIDPTRDSYYQGKIFNIGEQVIDNNGWKWTITDRRTNYVVVKDKENNTQKKWIWEIKEVK